MNDQQLGKIYDIDWENIDAKKRVELVQTAIWVESLRIQMKRQEAISIEYRNSLIFMMLLVAFLHFMKIDASLIVLSLLSFNFGTLITSSYFAHVKKKNYDFSMLQFQEDIKQLKQK